MKSMHLRHVNDNAFYDIINVPHALDPTAPGSLVVYFGLQAAHVPGLKTRPLAGARPL